MRALPPVLRRYWGCEIALRESAVEACERRYASTRARKWLVQANEHRKVIAGYQARIAQWDAEISA